MQPQSPSIADIVDSNKLLNEIDAAAFLDVAPGTLQGWRSTGRYNLPFVKIGRSVKYKLSDLESWFESRTRKSGATR